jgi:proteic killer suppression protein
MIQTFRHKGLKQLFKNGKTALIDKGMQARCIEVLDVINRSNSTFAMDIPGFNLHPLKQYNPWRWSIWISGQWRITFEFQNGGAYRVDFEQYH